MSAADAELVALLADAICPEPTDDAIAHGSVCYPRARRILDRLADAGYTVAKAAESWPEYRTRGGISVVDGKIVATPEGRYMEHREVHATGWVAVKEPTGGASSGDGTSTAGEVPGRTEWGIRYCDGEVRVKRDRDAAEESVCIVRESYRDRSAAELVQRQVGPWLAVGKDNTDG